MKKTKTKKEYKPPVLKTLGSLKQIIRGISGPFPEVGDETQLTP